MSHVEIPALPTPILISTEPTDDAIIDGGIDGLGIPKFLTPTMQRFLGEGVVGGRQLVGARSIEVEAFTLDPTVVTTLSGLMGARPDPVDVFPLPLVDIIVPGRRVAFVRPDGLEWIFDEEAHQEVVGLRLMFLAEDPVIYSETPTVEASSSSSSHSIEVTNAGNLATVNGRAWTLELTASGTVVNPWIEVDDRRVVFPVTLTSGQVLTVDTDRQTWIGSQRITGLPTTPGEDAPDWPVIPPGESDVTLGATSGSFAVELAHRATWLSCP